MKPYTPRNELPSLACFTNAVFRCARLGNRNYTIMTAVCAVLLMVGCATDPVTNDVSRSVPEVLNPPKGNTLAISLKARGFQIYECQARKSDPTQSEWIFKGPEADLFDRTGRKIGKHFMGPTWEHIDGSSVVGENPRPYAKDTNAIPWLLLGVKKTEGSGVFGKVTYIQRVDTVGGKATSGGCELSTVGKEIRVPYTASYHFYVATP